MPPQQEAEYETFAARVLHYTLLLLLCAALLFVPFASGTVQLIFIPVILSVLGVAYGLLHNGRFRLASLIFLTGLWLVITFASFSLNGVRNASISSYAIVIIYSAVLFTNRAVVVFTGASLLSVLILTLGEVGGILPLRATPLYLEDRVFQQIVLFGAAGILLFRASQVIRANFQRILEHEQLLIERNRALENEIAERQRTEARRRITEEKYRFLFENTPVGAAVYGQGGEIILLNRAAAQMLEGTPETLQGRNMRDVLPPDYAERGLRDHEKALKDGRPMLVEDSLQLLSGRVIYYLRHIMPLPDFEDQGKSQVLVMFIDLTEKYLAEQRERELALAQERNLFLTEFFSVLSHDLKNPLATITTSLYLLERAQAPQQRAEKVKQIDEQIQLMDRYIQDMLMISRLEHLPPVKFEMIDLNGLVDEVVELMLPRIEGRHLSAHIDLKPDLPPIHGEKEQLRRLLINLIENAINYSSQSGQMIVSTYTTGGRVTLEVTDSGIGIEPDALPHIFDRFFRTQSAKKFERSGTGMGLAIVKKIADMHNATIEVNSKVDEGTTFHICFSDVDTAGAETRP